MHDWRGAGRRRSVPLERVLTLAGCVSPGPVAPALCWRSHANLLAASVDDCCMPFLNKTIHSPGTAPVTAAGLAAVVGWRW